MGNERQVVADIYKGKVDVGGGGRVNLWKASKHTVEMIMKEEKKGKPVIKQKKDPKLIR